MGMSPRQRSCVFFVCFSLLFAACGSEQSGTTPCSTEAQCDDQDPCTQDSCDAGACKSVIVLGLECEDGDPCTEKTTCDVNGQCIGGSPLDLEADPCQDCSCDSENGLQCEFKAIGTTCDDANCCSTGDMCALCDPAVQDCAVGQTVCAGSSVDCSDDNDCTKDECVCNDPMADPTCTNNNEDDGSACVYSENSCTEGDSCQAGACEPGPPKDLDDENPCTEDLCVKGEITHEPVLEGSCEDGNECTIGDSCFLGNCQGGDEVECVLPDCAAGAECINGEGCVPTWLPAGASCDDGDNCTPDDACTEEHECAPTKDPLCDDQNSCTLDSCDPGAPNLEDQCTHTNAPNGTGCVQADPCFESSVCSNGACLGVPIDCDDQVACTVDSCNTVTGCVNTPNNALCDDNDPCTDNVCTATGCEFPDSTPPCGGGCTNGSLPNGDCCPSDGFCPEEDTTLAGENSFSLVHIPEGVTVRCIGEQPLKLIVSGQTWIHGNLRADGGHAIDGSYGSPPLGACGGFGGGDGYRMAGFGSTTLIEIDPTTGACYGDPEASAQCAAMISEKESYSGDPCVYLARAPGQPGFGPGGGYGGDMAMMLFGGMFGGSAGGGGGSNTGQGAPGADASNACGLLYGGATGVTYNWSLANALGGSGGGAAGFARNGACDECSGGNTGAGGNGGAGGGIIAIEADGDVHVTGQISVRGGDGAKGAGPSGPSGGSCQNGEDCGPNATCWNGSCYNHCDPSGNCAGDDYCLDYGAELGPLCMSYLVCTGGGGGGSGGVIYIDAASVITSGPGLHFDIAGGAGAPGLCSPAGHGGDGGLGLNFQ